MKELNSIFFTTLHMLVKHLPKLWKIHNSSVILDNTKKQDNLISRMDSIEDKMDYMQAKIDHIISSCIDE